MNIPITFLSSSTTGKAPTPESCIMLIVLLMLSFAKTAGAFFMKSAAFKMLCELKVNMDRFPIIVRIPEAIATTAETIASKN